MSLALYSSPQRIAVPINITIANFSEQHAGRS
jgi:hypothetical protein